MKHRSEGVRRLALVCGGVCVLATYLYLNAAGAVDDIKDVTGVVVLITALALAWAFGWGIVHAAAWVVEGFRKDRGA